MCKSVVQSSTCITLNRSTGRNLVRKTRKYSVITVISQIRSGLHLSTTKFYFLFLFFVHLFFFLVQPQNIPMTFLFCWISLSLVFHLQSSYESASSGNVSAVKSGTHSPCTIAFSVRWEMSLILNSYRIVSQAGE